MIQRGTTFVSAIRKSNKIIKKLGEVL